MATISEAFAIAIRHHQTGNLEAAEQIYRQILEVEPNHAHAWHLRGVVYSQRGDYQVAANYIRRAIELDPNAVDFHSNLGNALKEQGKLDEAAVCYRRALELKPDLAEAHNNLGTVWQDQGMWAEAASCYRRALELKPDYAAAHNNLGKVFQEQGNSDEAIACYRRALELNPDLADVHTNLGTVWQEQGKLDDAAACYRRALELMPNFAEAHNNLGRALQEQGNSGAIVCYRRALELKPDLAEAHNNLGTLWQEQGKLDESAACYHRALELKPNFAEAHGNLGHILQEQGKSLEAIACYRRALELKPDCWAAVSSLVHELQNLCLWEDLLDLSRRVIEAVHKNEETAIKPSVSPGSVLALPIATTSDLQLRCARQWVDGHLRLPVELESNPIIHRASALEPKINIGYLSADFYNHATAMLIAELIEKHDRGRFTIVGYSYGPDDRSPLRQRLVKAFDRFVELKDSSPMEAARRIAADGVDILVDLKGLTRNNRAQILALRPAPIQVNYLGYPGTMGASFMDYILVDDFIAPSERQPFYTERLVHLPGCYQVNDSRREISPRTPSRADCGLPEEGFVFCCFNNNYKITPEVFGVWMNLLQAIPDSVIWLLESNRFTPANLRREAIVRGIAQERLVFAPRLSLADHLARLRLADLFLDTFPVNAHTTASEALWVGCPLLTIAGESFVSRVAGSLLLALDLPELITTNLDDYETTALQLAKHPKRLADLRSRLRACRSTSALFDGGRFARNLEKAYATMWEIYASGEKPHTFRVSPE